MSRVKRDFKEVSLDLPYILLQDAMLTNRKTCIGIELGIHPTPKGKTNPDI